MDRRSSPLQLEGPRGTLNVTVFSALASASGAAESLVFLHPTNLDSRCWLSLVELLPACQCYLLDSRGHGLSHRNGPFFVSDYASDVGAVVDILSLNRFHMVGASLGGSVACAVAGAMPGRVSSISVLGGSLEPADHATIEMLHSLFATASLEEISAAFVSGEVAAGLDPALIAQLQLQINLTGRDLELIREVTLSAFSEDARHYAQGVSCRAQVLTGEWDNSCPPAVGERMARLLDGRFELLPSMGHLPMMQAPQLVARKLADFLPGYSA